MIKIENAEGTVLAFLNKLTDAKVKEVLNGEFVLSFVATIDHLKTDFLYDEENLINYENDLFRVIALEELHDEDNMLTVACECEHISYDLINNVMNDFNHTYASAAEVLALCLLGTDFVLRSCDITEKTDIQYTEECNSKQISIAIANNWHGELKYYRHYIDLLQSRGVNRGTGFIFGKNLKSVKRIINRVDKTVSYEVEVVQGSELEELGYYELGDTVRVMDERLGVDIEVKIIELEKNILTGINSRVILGDAIKDMRSSFSSVKKDVQEVKDIIAEGSINWDKVAEILDSNGNIVLGKLNTITQIATKIVNSTGTFEQRDNYLYWHDQPLESNSTFATKWGAQGLVFANSKDAEGNWIWQTALDADGLIATSVTSSCLNAITANILSLVVDNLIGKTITGVTINGSTFISDNVENGYSMMLTNGGIKFMQNNSSRASVDQRGGLFWGDSGAIRVEASENSFGKTGGKLSNSNEDLYIHQDNSQAYIKLDYDGGDIYLNAGYGSSGNIHLSPRTSSNEVIVYGAFKVLGSKNAIIPTQHYGVRSMYAEEADKSYFSTKGIAETINGVCIVELDPMFLEVIELNSTVPYIIQLTSYSDARIWVDSIEDDKFTIRSDKDTNLSYDLKAIRISYTNIYMEESIIDKKKLVEVQEAAVRRLNKEVV